MRVAVHSSSQQQYESSISALHGDVWKQQPAKLYIACAVQNHSGGELLTKWVQRLQLGQQSELMINCEGMTLSSSVHYVIFTGAALQPLCILTLMQRDYSYMTLLKACWQWRLHVVSRLWPWLSSTIVSARTFKVCTACEFQYCTDLRRLCCADLIIIFAWHHYKHWGVQYA